MERATGLARQVDKHQEINIVDVEARGMASKENILKIREELRRVLKIEEQRQRGQWRRKNRLVSPQESHMLFNKQRYTSRITQSSVALSAPNSTSTVRYDGSPGNLRASLNMVTTWSKILSACSEFRSIRILFWSDMSSGGWNSMYVHLVLVC